MFNVVKAIARVRGQRPPLVEQRPPPRSRPAPQPNQPNQHDAHPAQDPDGAAHRSNRNVPYDPAANPHLEVALVR